MATRNDIRWENVPVTARGRESSYGSSSMGDAFTSLANIVADFERMRTQNADKRMGQKLLEAMENPDAYSQAGSLRAMMGDNPSYGLVSREALADARGVIGALPEHISNQRKLQDDTRSREAWERNQAVLNEMYTNPQFSSADLIRGMTSNGVDARTASMVAGQAFDRFANTQSNMNTGIREQGIAQRTAQGNVDAEQGRQIAQEAFARFGSDELAHADNYQDILRRYGPGVANAYRAQSEGSFQDADFRGTRVPTVFPDTPEPMQFEGVASFRSAAKRNVPEWARAGSQYLKDVPEDSDSFNNNVKRNLNRLTRQFGNNPDELSMFEANQGVIGVSKAARAGIPLTDLLSPEVINSGNIPEAYRSGWFGRTFLGSDNPEEVIQRSIMKADPEVRDAILGQIDFDAMDNLASEEKVPAMLSAIASAVATSPQAMTKLFGDELPASMEYLNDMRLDIPSYGDVQHGYSVGYGLNTTKGREATQQFLNQSFGVNSVAELPISAVTDHVQGFVKNQNGGNTPIGAFQFVRKTLRGLGDKYFKGDIDSVAFTPETQTYLAIKHFDDNKRKGVDNMINKQWEAIGKAYKSGNPEARAMVNRWRAAEKAGTFRNSAMTYEDAKIIAKLESNTDLSVDITPQDFASIGDMTPAQIKQRNLIEQAPTYKNPADVAKQQRQREQQVYTLRSDFDSLPLDQQMGNLGQVASTIEGTVNSSLLLARRTPQGALLSEQDDSTSVQQAVTKRLGLDPTKTQNPDEQKRYTMAVEGAQEVIKRYKDKYPNSAPITPMQALLISEMTGFDTGSNWFGPNDAGKRINELMKMISDGDVDSLENYTARYQNEASKAMEALAMYRQMQQELAGTRQGTTAYRELEQRNKEYLKKILIPSVNGFSTSYNIPLNPDN